MDKSESLQHIDASRFILIGEQVTRELTSSQYPGELELFRGASKAIISLADVFYSRSDNLQAMRAAGNQEITDEDISFIRGVAAGVFICGKTLSIYWQHEAGQTPDVKPG